MKNRRADVRIRANLRFTFSWGPDAFELFRTVDVSAGGARVVHHVIGSPRPELGVVGECAFVLDGQELRCVAQVIRIDRDGFAVRFLGLTQVQESRIVAWIFRNEALHRVPA